MCVLTIVSWGLVIQPNQTTAATMFSNLGQTSVGSLAIASDSWRAEAFATGTNPGGYLLNSIQLQLGASIGTPSGFSLSIYNFNEVIPGNSLELLTGVEPSGSGVFTFESSGLVLQPNSAYFIVATATTPLISGSFKWDTTSWIDQSHVFDFSAGGLLYHSSDGQTWTYTRPNNFMFAINATIVPEPSSMALCLTGGILAASRYRRRRTRERQ